MIPTLALQVIISPFRHNSMQNTVPQRAESYTIFWPPVFTSNTNVENLGISVWIVATTVRKLLVMINLKLDIFVSMIEGMVVKWILCGFSTTTDWQCNSYQNCGSWHIWNGSDKSPLVSNSVLYIPQNMFEFANLTENSSLLQNHKIFLTSSV